MALATGTRLGRYEIRGPLGAGGMGEVYRARDERLDRDVAIKILPAAVAADPDRLARFEREAKIVAALSHPNVLAVYDAGTEQETTFVVMELLEGETLRERLAGGPLSNRRAVDMAVQIARGLTAAHAKGLVHRDLKPENVFVVADGHVKILDVGLAKVADAPGDGAATSTHLPAMTDPGTVLGTVGYMSPEQVRGQAVDARTDLFAFGAVFYEMLTGERAFKRETAAETLTAILREDPPDLPTSLTAQAPALDRIIKHCLEKSPTERFQSARDVAFALEALSGSSGTTSVAATVDAQAPARVTSRKAPLALAAGVVALAGIGAWLTGLVHFGRNTATGAALSGVTYHPLTFDEGFVFAARFARDGRTVAYSADWENQPRDLFVTSLVTYDRGSDAMQPLPNPRVSPAGDRLAYFACQDDGCTVRIADRSGKTLAESRRYADWWGLAWSSSGDEVWFAVSQTNGRQCTVYALNLAGEERLVFHAPGAFTIHDVSSEGRLLAAYTP